MMVRLIKDPALKQALSVSGIKAGIEHDNFLYNTKLTEYYLNNQKIIKDLLIQLVYKGLFYAVGCFQPTVPVIKVIYFSNVRWKHLTSFKKR